MRVVQIPTVIVGGDSISLGQTTGQPGDFQNVLREHLLQHFPSIKVHDLGFGGTTSCDLADNMAEITRRQRNPKTPVILWVGMVDSGKNAQGTARVTREVFEGSINTCITKLPEETPIFLIGIHYVDEAKTKPAAWGDHYRNRFIDEYNEVMRRVASRHSKTFVPTTDTILPEDLAEDGLHLRTSAYEKIAGQLAPMILQVL